MGPDEFLAALREVEVEVAAQTAHLERVEARLDRVEGGAAA